MKLQNKIAVITSLNSGIGLATAHEFKQRGARVNSGDQVGLELAKVLEAAKSSKE